MISVWLLFLKLLRATAGVKRPNEREIDDSRKDSLIQPRKEQEYLSEAVAMETSQLSEMADLKDYKMDVRDTEEEKCHQNEEDVRECFDAYFPKCLDTEKRDSPIMDELQNNEAANECASSEETDTSINLQEDIMVKDAEKEESNFRETTPSPEPDTDQQDQPEEEEGEDNNPSALDDGEQQHQEEQEDPKIEQDNNDSSIEYKVLQEETEQEEDNNPTFLNTSEIEYQENQESPETEQEDNYPSIFDTHLTEYTDLQESPKTEQEETSELAFDITEEPHQELQESPKEEQESVLEQQIKELAISDASTESCHDNDQDDLSDCLQVEMAIVSSDSDVEEQWKCMFSPVVDQEEFSNIPGPETLDTTLDGARNQEDVVEEDSSYPLESNTEPEDDVQETTNNTDIVEETEFPTDCELEDVSYEASIHYRSLTKIPEDDEEKPKHSLQRLSASTSELDKKLPQDYCVIQEMKSENVSTEHVDFRMARQQWQKMEERNKSRSNQFSNKQGVSQSGHSFMYTPVRTPERPKRDQDSDSLSLGDFQYTQFSPCSEDSGLDDTSYRSAYDEPETQVEREIRQTMEREETFRRDRVLSKDPAQGKHRPSTLMTSRPNPEERRRMYNTPEDRCRSQRSPSARTPTFSITTSPSSRPTYHEMVANNVIILEPDSYPASPRHREKGLLSPGINRFHEWPSDTSNVIILETSNLIIRSASEFCLSSCQETQESTFHNNPFFKLRSHSTQSLVDQEIKVVRQREEEFRRQRAQMYTKEKYDTVLVSPSLLESFTYDRAGEIPAKCKSSPSSPSKIRKMDRSVLSCDQKFPEAPHTGVRRKSALVQRWEAGIFANHQQD